MRIKYACPHILESDIRAVAEVLRSGTLTQGKETKKYEREVAKYVGARYCVAFNSATSALYSAFRVVGIGTGTLVATTPITFVATANAIKNTGALVELQDRRCVTSDFCVPVHYSGRPAPFYGNTVVEDASHALGSQIGGKMVGSCVSSDVCVFSTHAIKNITTGEGGLATTNIPEYYDELKKWRDHGRGPDGCELFGFNFRLTDFQAALGRAQLKRINAMRDQREEIFAYYNQHLEGYVETPEERSEPTFWHLYPILLPNTTKRDKLQSYLRRRGVETQIHYRPVYLEPVYQAEGYEKGLCPRAEDFWRRELSLPMHNCLHKDEVDYVIDNIRRWVGKNA